MIDALDGTTVVDGTFRVKKEVNIYLALFPIEPCNVNTIKLINSQSKMQEMGIYGLHKFVTLIAHILWGNGK